MSSTHFGLKMDRSFSLILFILPFCCVSQDIGDCVQSGTYYINRTGMSITLTAAVNITNGPINHTIWTDQDDLPVNITHDSRFQTPETGMLTIDDVSSADIGVWVFGIVNNSETLICNVTLALPEQKLIFEDSRASSDDNGKIEIKWQLKHLAALSEDEVTFKGYCASADKVNISSSGDEGNQDYELEAICNGTNVTCFKYDYPYNGSVKLGPVEAGRDYTCALIADSSNENVLSGEMMFSNIKSSTGIPSTPSLSINVLPGHIVITVSSLYAGLQSNDNSFRFHVKVDDEYNEWHNFSDYTDNKSVTINVTLPAGSNYEVEVSSSNQYGKSEYASYGPFNITEPSPAPPSPSHTPSTSPPSVPIGAIAGGVVGGVVVVAIIVGVVIAVAVFIVMRNKKKKGSLKITPKEKPHPV